MKQFFERLSWQIIFAAFLLIFFVRNLLMPLVADDFSYAFIWKGDIGGNLMVEGDQALQLQRVQSFSDILASQWSHYFTWGGRTIAHIFVQFFVWQGKPFFDVANVFVFAALVLLLFKLGTNLPLREMNKSYLLLILAGLYFCAPSFLITTTWLTGACNYLWMCTLTVLFLFMFTRDSVPKPLMAVLGLIAGWSIEPGAAVSILVTFVWIILAKRDKKLKPHMIVGFIFLVIGAAILVLSPGNFNRVELTIARTPEEIYTPDKQWTAEMFWENFIYGFLPVFLRELILFVPIIFYFVKAKTSPVVTRFILMFAGSSVLILMIMMLSPEFPERAGFPSTIFLLIASLAALKEILPSVEKFFSRRVKFSIFLAAFWLASLAGCLYVEYDVYSQFEARDKIFAEHKNDDLITLSPLKLPEWSETLLGSRTWDEFALIWGGDFEPEWQGMRNVVVAHYYGLKKIVVEDTH